MSAHLAVTRPANVASCGLVGLTFLYEQTGVGRSRIGLFL